MKIQSILFISHAAIAAVAVVVMLTSMTMGTGVAAGLAIVAMLGGAVVASFGLAKWFKRGLRQVEAVVADHASVTTIGIDEFDQTATQVSSEAVRWDDVAANHRDQARDFQSIMLLLDRRSGDAATSFALRKMLAGIGGTLHSHLKQIESGTADIERYTQEIADGAEAQSKAVTKTTTYVEQMSSNIDLVTGNAESVKQAIDSTSESAAQAHDLVARLAEGMDRIGQQCLTSESRLRGLADPSQQVSAIVESIGDIAARTDMLALNASIESIRAGEHGRGFAVVADEVRKLAEQASQATSEITQLLDSMRNATQESIVSIAGQRGEVAAETKLADEAKQILARITASRNDDQSRAKEITAAAHQQLQLAQDVVLAVEQISQVAKSSRSSAESACWTMRSLTKTTPQFDAVVERLRGCSDATSDNVDAVTDTAARHVAPAAITSGMPESVATLADAV
mgnify:CR=1 FL=1|tara:strand:+ start:19794 stop:21161 length:1368 start_codon:yes stop_codon:yes gene_type:complete